MSSSRTAIAILAGGHGTRLWPLSRPERPKQFVPVLPEGSMLQATFARARRVVDANDILVVGSREHRDLYLNQLPELPEENLLLEPVGCGTGPCIAFAAAVENRRGRFDVIVTVPADHVIANPDEWVTTLKTAAKHAAEHEVLVSIAAVIKSPEVKFGYLLIEDRVGGSERNPISRVSRFVEKPSRTELESLFSDGRCLRNMGMIAFNPGVIQKELARYLPEVFQLFDAAQQNGFEDAAVDLAYSTMPKASIDVSVLQRTKRLTAVASTIRSIDAGDFATLGDVLPSDAGGNAVIGPTVMVDANSNTVVSDGATVAMVGANDLVVVVDGDTVLVCPKDHSQRIREVAD